MNYDLRKTNLPNQFTKNWSNPFSYPFHHFIKMPFLLNVILMTWWPSILHSLFNHIYIGIFRIYLSIKTSEMKFWRFFIYITVYIFKHYVVLIYFCSCMLYASTLLKHCNIQVLQGSCWGMMVYTLYEIATYISMIVFQVILFEKY